MPEDRFSRVVLDDPLDDPKGERVLYMSNERYLTALKRQKERIEAGLVLKYFDSDSIGDKDTQVTWGLCSGEKEAWPSPYDHLWPLQFKNEGRVAPLYRTKGQICPFDDNKDGEPMGCFYRCRVFQRKRKALPTKEEAVTLYAIRIKKAEGR